MHRRPGLWRRAGGQLAALVDELVDEAVDEDVVDELLESLDEPEESEEPEEAGTLADDPERLSVR